MDATHDPGRRSWVESANDHADFPIQNLPFGMFSTAGTQPRGGIAIGDMILDLGLAAAVLPKAARTIAEAAAANTDNAFLGLGVEARRSLRIAVSALLSEEILRGEPGGRARLEPLLHPAADCLLHLPARIGDYTDFFAGIHHATNAGKLFRPENPLLPNYKHVPVAYHGRASSVRASGAPVQRPNGQRKPASEAEPSFGPSQRLDYEMELGIWIGTGNGPGESIAIATADQHIAGYCLLNDWSARDIQAWEAQPLGPFLAKNFGTSVSPWIVTAEALEPFRIAQAPRPEGDPRPFDYLWDDMDQARGALDLELEVWLERPGLAPFRLSLSNAKHLYWTPAQMVAHHTVGGCNLSPGDLFGSGTISSPEVTGFGALLEITEGGRKPVILPDGAELRFLQDGDTIVMRAAARRDGFASIGFGECRGTVQAAR